MSAPRRATAIFWHGQILVGEWELQRQSAGYVWVDGQSGRRFWSRAVDGWIEAQS